jgi:hypothetical protein
LSLSWLAKIKDSLSLEAIVPVSKAQDKPYFDKSFSVVRRLDVQVRK